MALSATARSAKNKAARDAIFTWFHGHPDQFSACDAIVTSGFLGEWWWFHASAPRVRTTGGARCGGLGLTTPREIMEALLPIGWQALGSLSGTAEERAELKDAGGRVKLLRAVAALEDILNA